MSPKIEQTEKCEASKAATKVTIIFKEGMLVMNKIVLNATLTVSIFLSA